MLGQYIRGRRLSCAALELRMTRSSILSIALKYRFDSQQTLTRAFIKQFGVVPVAYQNSHEWNHARLTPPLLKGSIPIVAPKVITLPQQYLNGILHGYISANQSR
ncbi:MAG: helix-turn-helix domain-containing protein [Candidatus Malihini olakiniferum]